MERQDLPQQGHNQAMVRGLALEASEHSDVLGGKKLVLLLVGEKVLDRIQMLSTLGQQETCASAQHCQ